ncbi:hypothetical protein [Chroococcidiopsis sp.]|uniref:hypothetical protein n=1 Tax=Chroococcidiopsis sp. TaxID=3088168 RepID=UPI003F3D6806
MYLLQPLRAKFSAQHFSPVAGNEPNSQLERLKKPVSHTDQAMQYRNHQKQEKQKESKQRIRRSTRPTLIPLALKDKLKRDAFTKPSEESPLV